MDDITTHDPSRLLSTQSMPSEILLKIFGMLTQGDCLRCMSVCRAWYKTIPQYTHHCFRSVFLKGNRGHADNTRLQKCLGSHVKSAVLDSCDTQAQLEALLTMFDRHQCYDIRQLCIRRCPVRDGNTLIQHLQRLERLERISFHNTRFDVAILSFLSSLISTCRSLTHLTCNTTFAMEGVSLPSESMLIHDSEINHNMRFLRLGLHTPTLSQALVLLVRCPQLRYFSTCCANDVDARLVLLLCPKLAFFECQMLAKRYRRWLDHNDDDDDEQGLPPPPPPPSVQQEQQRSSTSLRELTLEPISFEQQVLDLHHPCLQRLEVGVTHGDEEIIRGLLRNTPMVEELRLCFYDVVDYIPAMIQPLSNLRNLQLWLLRTRENQEELIPMFEGFHHLLPPDLSVSIKCNLYQHASPHTFRNILLSMAGIRQLKCINLHSLQNIDDNHLISFFEHVSQHQIEAVTLAFPTMSFSLLYLIAHRLPHLVHFEIAYCGGISRRGLRTLVETKARTSPGKLTLKIRLSYMDDGTKANDIHVCIGQDPFPLIQ